MVGQLDEPTRPQEDSAAISRETLVAVSEGDPAALSEFFEYCFDRVYSLVARLVGERTAAEDVTQEIFIKIQRAAGRLDPTRDPMPWVTVIAYNACRDHWRSREHRAARDAVPIDDEEGGGDRVANGRPDPEARVLRGEREQRVQDALLRLPGDLRVVVILRDYHGMKHEQIAGVVGASEAAVRKRYSRALARLAEDLKGFWNE